MAEQIFFSRVVQNLPTHWDRMGYENKVYGTVKLDDYGRTREEYSEIREFCKTKGFFNNIEIERIQYPIAYASYMLRKEQLEKRGCSPTVTRILVEIGEKHAKEAITSNCDRRRTELFTITNTSMRCYIVQKKLSADEDRESNSFPEYVIYVPRT